MTTQDSLPMPVNPADVAARIHAARRQMALLTHRARKAAITAVRVG